MTIETDFLAESIQHKERWQKVTLGDIAFEVSERIENPSQSGFERFVGLEHIDSGNFTVGNWDSTESVTSAMKLFKSGDVLFARRNAYLRRASMVQFDGVCSGDAIVLREKPEMIVEGFLVCVLNTDVLWNFAIANAAGSMSKRVKWRDLAEYEFALPPKDEQRRIADILWAADESIQKYDNCLLAQEAIKETLLNELFLLDDTIPCVSFGSVGHWMSGGTPSRSKKEFWNGSVPWASPKDMKIDVLTDTEEHITEEGVKNGSRIIPEGAILIVVRGMILAHTFPIAITETPVAFNQDMKALMVSQEFSPMFIFYWLQSKSKEILRMVSDSSHGTKRISTEQLFEISVPHIPLNLQIGTVNILGKCDTTKQHIQNQCSHLRQLKNMLLQTLFKN